MCGRFLILENSLQQAETIAEIPAWIQGELRFGEIFPSMPALVLKENAAKNGLVGDIMKFGYLYEAKNRRIINARAETVEEKWMFKRAFAKNRVVVVCTRFYEWDAIKQKVSFYEPGETMYLGALAIDDAFVILTKEANASVADFHHRMPVIFNGAQARAWVEDKDLASALLKSVSPMLEHDIPGGQPALF